MRFIYVVISKTPTKFAKLIRLFSKTEYNHAAISLDDDFQEIYGFARKQHNTPFYGGLVHESYERYTFGGEFSVPITVFRLPVSDEKYQEIEEDIKRTCADSKIIYNIISVLTYPVLHGISVPKAYTCSEYVWELVKKAGYELPDPRRSYLPEDFLRDLKEYFYYAGTMREYLDDPPIRREYMMRYYAPFTLRNFFQSLNMVTVALYRTVRLGKAS